MSVLTVPAARAESGVAHVTIRSLLPDMRTIAGQALPRLAEATLIPLVLFYSLFWAVGIWGALSAALVWSYGCLLHRVISGRRMPGMLALATMALTVRTVIALVSGSLLAYFAAPVLGTVMVAGVFAVSLRFGQPLAERLVRELGILPPELLESPAVQAHLRRVTVMWAVENLINAGLTMLLLLTQSLVAFLAVKTVVGWALSAACIAVCGYDFRRTMRAAARSGVSPVTSAGTTTAPALPVGTGAMLLPAVA